MAVYRIYQALTIPGTHIGNVAAFKMVSHVVADASQLGESMQTEQAIFLILQAVGCMHFIMTSSQARVPFSALKSAVRLI